MKKIIALFALFCLASVSMMAQTVITMGTGSSDVTGCNFVIYDNGGINGDYGPNRNDLLTIHSSNTSAHCVQIKIILTDFDVHDSDTLFIYDGVTDADSLLLGFINNSVAAGTSSQDLYYTATVNNPSGALTLKFVSDADSCGTGFIINTECVAPCQRVGIEIDSLLSSHYPIQGPDGFFYVDLCPYDTLHMVVHGVFPDNDFSYHQDDASSTFYWDLSVEGEYSGVGMNVMDHYFPTGRGYDISINVEDSAGCKCTMPAIFRIRTSKNPIKKVSQLPPMCTGDEISVDATYSNLSIIQVDSVYSEQLTTLKVCDTIFLPDGQDCGSGCAYRSSVTFTAFSPTATIQDENDILYVRAKLEHSFVGDIYIALECPNGQRAALLKKYNGGSSNCSGQIPTSDIGWNAAAGSTSTGAYFGEANDANDNSSNKCDPITNPMGHTWNYCWSNNTALGYTYASGSGYVYETVNTHSVPNVFQSYNATTIDSSNMTNMTQIYHPDQPFSQLIGCPMNGTWSITVLDGYGVDNGWLTEWEMALDPSLLPQDWTYTVHPDSMYITGPGAAGSYIIPDSSGNIEYTATVVDEFNCHYDTLLNIEVVERPHPDLGPDVDICHGELYLLESHYDYPGSEFIWNTGERTPDIYLTSAGEYSVRVTVTNEDGLACSGADSINVNILPKPIPEFTTSDTAGCVPLTVHFQNTSHGTEGVDLQYLWTCYDENWNVVLTSDKKNPDLKFEHSGTYTVKLVITTANGCVDSLFKWNYITVNYQPTAEFDALPEVALWAETDGSIFFQVQGDTTQFGDDMGFKWDFADGSVDSSAYALEHNFSTWGDYDVTLSMFTPEGCNSSITHTVSLEADLVFPNVITPNGDGVNDVFAIGNLNTSMNQYDPDKYRNNELYIYDRWGKEVYHAEHYDTFMDMTGDRGDGIIVGENVFDAGKVSDGTYYYSFYYKGKLKTVNYHGTLQIIRDRK